jgi:PhnB protein
MKRVTRTRKLPALPEQLDKAVQTIMTDHEAGLPRVNARIAPVLRVAADLRGMPDSDFKQRLKRELVARAGRARQSARATAVPAKRMPEGFHSITPYLRVNDAAKLIDFLRRAFGAEEILRVPRDDGKIMHAQVRVEGSMVELADITDRAGPNPTAIWLFVPDADAAYRRAIEAGAASIHAPVDQDYGDREGSVKDPFGNHWYIGTHRTGVEPSLEELRSVTPYLHPKGSAKLIEFMIEAFDANEVFRAEDEEGGMIHHAWIRIGDSMIAIGEAHGQYKPMPPTLHLYVDDADLVYARAIKAGATSISKPADQPYGERSGGVRDPFDNEWYIATHKDAPAERSLRRAAEQPRYLQPGNIMPFIYSENVAKACDFYKNVFGATEVHRIERGGRPSHVQIAIGQTRLMLRDATTDDLAEYRAQGYAATPHSLGGTPLHLYVYVADADAAFKRAIEAGSKLVDKMEDKEWGDRCGGVQDPFGHIWYIATPRRSA